MKKIYLILLLIASLPIFFTAISNTSFAQTETPVIRDLDKVIADYEEKKPQSYNPQNLDLGTNPDVPKNLSTYTQSVFIEITSAASCLLSGKDPIRPDQPCLGFDPETKKIGYVENNGGALGLMGGLIASTYNIPASYSDYTTYLAANFGITKKATAAIVSDDFCEQDPALCEDSPTNWGFGTGNGFGGLSPLLGVWTAMRNLVYLLFVLIFIVLGLGVMFRIQIDPRAVLSIQNQLPKIVIALVLVTFSYAIAGFLIDMMYLSLFLIINIFQAEGLKASTTLATNPINAAGGLGGISHISNETTSEITSVVASLFDGSTFGSTFKGILNFIVNPVGTIASAVGGGLPIIGGITDAISSATSSALDFVGIGISKGFVAIAAAIAWLILMIALFSALLRLWFILIKTYVFILINVTFAPIWIAFGLLPGSSLTFGNWIRALVSNLAAFPLVLILFSLGKTLQDGFTSSDQTAFVPPYVGNPGDMSAFASIIGMGMILLAPEAVNMTKAALKAPESKLGSAVGRSLGTGQGVVGGVLGGAKTALWHTNPYTNQPSRFKAAVKSTAGKGLEKLPGASRVSKAFSNILPSNAKRAADAAEEARKKEAAKAATTPPEGDGYTS